jgi:hypothetical protein
MLKWGGGAKIENRKLLAVLHFVVDIFARGICGVLCFDSKGGDKLLSRSIIGFRAISEILSFVLFLALVIFFGSLLFSLQYFALVGIVYISMLFNFVLISWDLSLFFAVMRYYCFVVSLIVMIPFYVYFRNVEISNTKKSGYVWAVGFALEQTLRYATLPVFSFLILKRLQHTSFLFCVFGVLARVKAKVVSILAL